MVVSLLSVVVAALAFLYAGRTRGVAGREPRVRLLLLGGCVLGAWLVARLLAAMGDGPSLKHAFLAIPLVALLWIAVSLIVGLCIRRVRTPGWIAIGIGLVIATPLVIVAAPPLLIAIVLLPLTGRTPWYDRRTGVLMRLVVLAASLAVLGPGREAFNALPELHALQTALASAGAAFVLSYALVLTFKLALTLPGRLFDYLRLRERLLVSYTLVAGIPVVLGIGFLGLLALMIMGSYRAGVSNRLLAPGPETRQIASALLADPELTPAIRAQDHGRFDAFLARHLPAREGDDIGRGTFVLAAVRDRADTTIADVAAGPLDSTPAAAFELRRVIPPCPYDGFLLTGEKLYTTHGVSAADEVEERVVQLFVPMDRQRLVTASEITQVELHVFFTDSLTASVEAGEEGSEVNVEISDEPNIIRLSSVNPEELGADPVADLLQRLGVLMGGREVDAYRMAGADSLRNAGGLLIVRSQWKDLVAAVRESLTEPVNQVIAVVLAIIGVLFMVVLLAALVTGGTIARRITQSVSTLTRATRRLARDDLEPQLEIERGDELGELAIAFNAMAGGLKERRNLLVEQERLRGELEIAHDIQQRMLPVATPESADFDFAGVSVPSREVGGDAYDFLPWGDGEIAITVADVAGKGVPAALLMSNLQASVRAHARRPGSPAEVVSELNELVCASTQLGRFITFFLAVIDPRKHDVTYVNAGHDPPILRHTDGTHEKLTEGGPLLGTLRGLDYAIGRAHLRAGDLLVLYTDGVVEARRDEDDFFGEMRLTEVIRQAGPREPAVAIRDRIIAAVREFAGETEQSDDITIVVVRRRAEVALPEPEAPARRG